jgi:2-oxopent-4-enoate/cis-2-oxohex-4-enoate hydratase
MNRPSNDPDQLAAELFTALNSRRPVALMSARHPDMTVDAAYAVSLGVLERRLARGERVVGKKIGLTAKAVQDALGINEPDFGFLTDAMAIDDGATVVVAEHLMTPMIEAEIAFVLKDRLVGPGVTADQVLAATDYVTASFEIVDTRFDTPRIRIVDTVADNASSALFVLGKDRVNPRPIDLSGVHCSVFRNGDQVLEGVGAAVMGSPQNAVAWLANRLGDYGVTLDAGDVVLSGSLVPLVPARPGDRYEARFSGLGVVNVAFV